MYDLSIKIKNYKCFKDESGFDEILRVNLIIGRNNTGKSSLLDIIEIVATGETVSDRSNWRENNEPKILFESTIDENIVDKTFPENINGGAIRHNHNAYGKGYIGRKIAWSYVSVGQTYDLALESCDDQGISPPLNASTYANALTKNMPNPLFGKIFRRLLAERDILDEAYSDDLDIKPNGSGITNVIQNFINNSSLPSSLVKKTILGDLNLIFADDCIFTDITCQFHTKSKTWEIYLEEKYKGHIALSKSGSGLKTVISVLAYLILVPHLEHKPLSKYIFGFEELENNIHPALLRRLNNYIYKSSKDNDFIYFMTTHSNVLIDQFSKQSDAQIVHVVNKNTLSTCKTVKTYFENNGILDDLDVKASDLLQSNGIIWVEGPSDRIYLNRWISLWSDDALKEGTHYQIIFYGGRLLSHLSGEVPIEVESGISIFNANRNALIMIDSDKKAKQSHLNTTKKRIQKEFNDMDSYCWITQGKEVENYIPSIVVDEFLGKTKTSQVGIYDCFFEYLNMIVPNEGSKYKNKKPLLAEKLIPLMTKNNLKDILDIDTQMSKVIASIKDWNN